MLKEKRTKIMAYIRKSSMKEQIYHVREQNIREHAAILAAVKKEDSLLVQKLLHQHYNKHISEEV